MYQETATNNNTDTYNRNGNMPTTAANNMPFTTSDDTNTIKVTRLILYNPYS